MNRRALLALSAAGAWSIGTRGSAQEPAPSSGAVQRGRWVDEFARGQKSGSDFTATLQRAIDSVRDEALRAGDTSHLPSLLLPSGHYVLTGTIVTSPWVKLCATGGVLLDFSRLSADRDGIVCRNETSIPGGDLRYPGNRSPFLDGSGGTISILGPGLSRSGGWGVVLGNEDPHAGGAVREAGGRNVIVTGWRGAMRIDPVNTYLTAWLGCRFEQNREECLYVASPGRKSINSGERMTYFDCTFAGSKRALHIDSDSMDFVLDACSFDFNGDVIAFGPRARYGTVAMNHCHVEGFDGLLVDATQSGARLRVAIRDSIVLPRHWKKKDLKNVPRPLVAGNVRLNLSGVEFRFEGSGSVLEHPLIADDVSVEAISAPSFPGHVALPWRGLILNADSGFAHDAPGTELHRLTHWAVDAKTLAGCSGEIGSIAPGSARALVLKAVPWGGAHCTLTAKSGFALRPGELTTVACEGLISRCGAAVSLSLDFVAADGTLLLQAASDSSRDDVTVLTATAPAGTSGGVLHATFSGWAGNLPITGLAAWRAV